MIQVGPDFLDQVALWPQHAGVVPREDDDVAVVIGTTGRGSDACHGGVTHGAARECATTSTQLPSPDRRLADWHEDQDPVARFASLS